MRYETAEEIRERIREFAALLPPDYVEPEVTLSVAESLPLVDELKPFTVYLADVAQVWRAGHYVPIDIEPLEKYREVGERLKHSQGFWSVFAGSLACSYVKHVAQISALIRVCAPADVIADEVRRFCILIPKFAEMPRLARDQDNFDHEQHQRKEVNG